MNFKAEQGKKPAADTGDAKILRVLKPLVQKAQASLNLLSPLTV